MITGVNSLGEVYKYRFMYNRHCNIAEVINKKRA